MAFKIYFSVPFLNRKIYSQNIIRNRANADDKEDENLL